MTRNGKIKQYSIWPNIMKAILISTVVLAHSNHMPYEIGKIIYWFHMPCFFILSGLFFKMPELTQITVQEWIIKKAKKMLIPCLVYFLICSVFEDSFDIKKILYFLYGGKMVGGVYWFITVLFLSHIAMLIVLSKLHAKAQWCFVFVMYTAGVIWSNLMVPDSNVGYPMYLRFPWNADVVFVALPYVYIGYKMRDFIFNKNVGKTVYLASGVGALGIISVTVYLFVSGNLNFLIDMRYSVYKNWLLTLVIPICFFIVLFLLSKAVEKIPVINNVLFYIGDASLIIMYLHLMIKDNVVIPVWGEGYSIWLYLLVSVIISMTVYFISKRNTLTNWLFNGKVK